MIIKNKEWWLHRWQTECVRREVCSGQVRKRLISKLETVDVEYVINSLIRDKFLDDLRFANAYVKDKTKFSGWGRRKTEQGLLTLGISRHIIKNSLNTFFDSEEGENLNESILIKLAQKKWDSLKKEEDLYNKRNKLIRFLIGRGFEYDKVMALATKFK